MKLLLSVKNNNRIEDKKWFSFYPKIDRAKITYYSWFYFDSRPVFVFQLTHLLLFALPFVPYVTYPLFLILFFYGWGTLYIHLPFDSGKYDECEYPSYGFYMYGHGGLFDIESLWINLGNKNKVIYMPWSLKWYRTSILLKDDTWENEYKGNSKQFYLDEWKDKLYTESHPYTYITESGEIQKCNAIVTVEEREWRRRMLYKLKLFNKVDRCISVEFDRKNGIGELADTCWKGGCTGCSYSMKKNESVLECLRRMEKERKFN